jgi:hypothetical protein
MAANIFVKRTDEKEREKYKPRYVTLMASYQNQVIVLNGPVINTVTNSLKSKHSYCQIEVIF